MPRLYPSYSRLRPLIRASSIVLILKGRVSRDFSSPVFLPSKFTIGESRPPCVFFNWEAADVNLYSKKYLLVPNTPGSPDSPEFSLQSVKTLRCINHQEVETPWCTLNRGVETLGNLLRPGVVFDTEESFLQIDTSMP